MKHIKLDINEGTATLTLSRPPLNVLNIEMMGEISEALHIAGREEKLRVLLFEAEGKAFSAGVDVGDHTGEKARTMLEGFNELIGRILEFPVPTVALVNGAALGGGCEITLACDLVIATERAKFGQPEIRVGVYPPPAVVLLPKLVGPRHAADLILTGRTVSANEAKELGLVNRLILEEEIAAEVAEVIGGLASLSATVLRHTIHVLRTGKEYRERMKDIEPHYLWDLMRTKDAEEGLRAFLEKRPPEWTHE